MVEFFNAPIGQDFTVLITTSGGVIYMYYLDDNKLKDLKKLKYLVYYRRSSEDNEDRQTQSIPGQKLDVKEQILDRYGLNVINQGAPYEESQSGFKTGRPCFNDLMARIKNGEADGVIVWHPSRVARNYGDGGAFVQLMLENKIKIVLTCFGIFDNNPRDREYLMAEFSRATRDSDDKSVMVKTGNRTKFNTGWWSGPAKQGYLNFTDPTTKEHIIIKDKDRFLLLQNAARLILNDSYTPMQAFNKLNDEWGYRTRKTKRQGGNKMSESSFYKFIEDPFYYGLLARLEGQMIGKHEPMITKEDFDRLQVITGRRGCHVTEHEFAFKEPLRCGECGGSITCEERWQIICSVCKTKFHKGKDVTSCPECKTLIEDMAGPTTLHYIHYHCTKKANKNCSQGCISLKTLEEKIDEEIKRYDIPEKLLVWAVDYLNELNDKETEDREVVRSSVKDAYDDCVKRLDNLLKLKISPQNMDGSVISDEEYALQHQPLLAEKTRLMAKINGTDQRINKWHELSVNTFNFVCYARFWLVNGGLKQRTQILTALGSDLIIKDRNLLIDGQKYFFLIEEGKKNLQQIAERFGPTTLIDLLMQKDPPEVLRTEWLGS
ncbi:MAG: recombinase family protein [candidate division WWE3 bacterium]|nr:recombinase family protein [candidate division WWE3 bacterium]